MSAYRGSFVKKKMKILRKLRDHFFEEITPESELETNDLTRKIQVVLKLTGEFLAALLAVLLVLVVRRIILETM